MLSILLANEQNTMNSDQIRYLHAMGIQPWQLKNKPIIQKLMIIGETLGTGEALLNAMLESIGLDKSAVYMPPYQDIAKQIALKKPTLLLMLGEIATQALLETKTPIEQLRGKILSYGESNTPLIITYDPAYLLRNPKDKHKAFQDLQQVQRLLID